MWAKISNSATKMACVACIAIAATLPAAGSTAEQIADENARLAAFTDVDAFSAIPFYQRQGWAVDSDEFDISTAGPHRKLFKKM